MLKKEKLKKKERKVKSKGKERKRYQTLQNLVIYKFLKR